ncbi:MAG: ABC transporter ATP-binding protein [Magnetococcus sp. DMHC-6]
MMSSGCQEPLLVLEEVDAAYGPVQALTGVCLKVFTGEIVTLIGANGAGKSTLLMTLFGIPRPQRGRILFQGEDLSYVPTHQLSRLGLSLVPEGRRVFPGMTVVENLEMGGIGLESVMPLEEIFALFPKLAERRRQRAGTLSGGEQQMLAIGRALRSRPKLLLLDEPSLGLAPLIIRQIFNTLGQIVQSGATIFLVEQNANQALRLANRGYVLVNGQIQLAGESGQLLRDPLVRRAYLGGD